jgi:hypothetical protein
MCIEFVAIGSLNLNAVILGICCVGGEVNVICQSRLGSSLNVLQVVVSNNRGSFAGNNNLVEVDVEYY